MTPDNKRFLVAANELYGFSQRVVIVSVSDNTNVRIEDRTGNSWSITLERLQTYTYTISTIGEDLSGYRVTTSKPVSVFSGNKLNKVLNYRGADAMYVSLPPVTFWDTIHFIPSILERPLPAGHVVHVIADESTVVTNLVTGSTMTLDAQEHYATQPGDDGGEGMALECSQPCLVVQLIIGRGYDASPFDPSMRIIPGLQSYIRYSVFTYSWPSYQIRKLRVAHAQVIPGTFSPPLTSKETAS